MKRDSYVFEVLRNHAAKNGRTWIDAVVMFGGIARL